MKYTEINLNEFRMNFPKTKMCEQSDEISQRLKYTYK